METHSRTITTLFEPTQRYVVPMFQRHYVWSRDEQWEPLWDDINEKLRSRNLAKKQERRVSPHFLGAVILDSTRSSSTKEIRRFVVIDGQQRLTTFQLLLAAIRDVANNRSHLHIARAVERCLLNPDVELMERPDEEQYKLWPTQVNREAFCQIISAGSFNEVRNLFPVVKKPRKKNPEPRERLAEAYEFFYGKISDACKNCDCDDDANELMISILGVLRDDFTVVEIILGDNDDSQEIFNSLNARGKPLSQSDLLRSYIFMRAEKMDIVRDRLYNEYWSRFEDKWWDVESRRGNVISSRLDALTRILLAAKLGSTIDVRRVHSEYASWIETCSPYESIEDELKDFVKYGTHYEQLFNRSKGVLTTFGSRIGIWDTSTVFPLAIFLAAEGGMIEAELLKCLAHIESLIVRRAVCGLVTKDYNKYFAEIIMRLRNSGVSAQSLVSILIASDSETRRFPNDEEFATAWKSKPFYDRLSSWQITSILSRLEIETRSSRAEDAPMQNISVEHIMPQQWTDNYTLNGMVVPKEMNADWYFNVSEEKKSMYEQLKLPILKRRIIIHNIGNLTAVTQPLNAAMRNAGFADKKAKLRESVLALNRYFDSIPEWDEQAIQERADKLFFSACKAWPAPVKGM